MVPEITLECDECHNRVNRPVHINSNGHMYVKAQKLICACCREGEMQLVEDPKPKIDPKNCDDSCPCKRIDDCFDKLYSRDESKVGQSGWLTEQQVKKRQQLLDETDNWFTEEPDMQKILTDQGVLHMAKPKCQVHRSGDLYHKLLEVIMHEGIIRFPDGRMFAIEEAGKSD